MAVMTQNILTIFFCFIIGIYKVEYGNMLFDLSYKLNYGERLVSIVQKHWFLIVPRFAKFLIIISLLIIFANKFVDSKAILMIIAVLAVYSIAFLVYLWILLRVDYFIITSDRIIKINQKGIWNRNLSEILVLDIGNIALSEKGIAAAFLKFGSIKIILKNRSTFDLINIADPLGVYQGLIKLKEIKKA